MARPRLDYRLVDADNHYYEPDDCCTRHLDPAYRDRAVHVATLPDGTRQWRFGAKPLGFHRGARDFALRPGALRELFAGEPFDADAPPVIPTDQPVFRDRDARLRAMDQQGVEAAILLPSFGVSFEHDARSDPPAALAAVRAFNRFVEDDWGYAHRGRIFAPALLSLLDRDLAVAELERVLAAGARLVALRPGPVYGRSPADPYFDPFWARLAEARVPLVLHIGVSGYPDLYGTQWGEPGDVAESEMSAFQWVTCFGERPIVDTLAALVLHNLFGRHRALRVLSLENGSRWVPGLLRAMDTSVQYSVDSKGELSGRWLGGRIHDRPGAIFREHVFVAPFWEEPVADLVGTIGAERVLFGSDWPHPEGVPQPLDFLRECEGLGERELRRVLRENTAELLGLAA
jgi:predicted TIM-barrel fold metal-dependent hydrolase